VSLLLPVERSIKHAEGQMAMGLERAHTEFLGQGESRLVGGFGLLDRWRLVLCMDLAEEAEGPYLVIGMKLSTDSCRRRDGFEWLTEIFLKYVRGCPSFSRGLGRQTFGGGTGTLQKAVQLEFGLKMACIHLAANAWKCRTSFSRLRSRFCFNHSVARICGQSASLNQRRSIRPYR
jgi:hypothetical protein